MRKTISLLIVLLVLPLWANSQETGKTFTIETSVGTMKGFFYADAPRHVKAFTDRAARGDFNGTLFTRVIPGFMIQGGSLDSRNAPAGARVGFGDSSTEILPEFNPAHYHKKGALAAPRQDDAVNPQQKSDMSQFFIVQGKTYRQGQLDTLELVKNVPIRRKAMAEFYQPFKQEMDSLGQHDPAAYNRRVVRINQQVDSVLRATPGHLLFSDEQRAAYTTIGGSHHLDGVYTVYGEVTEGLDLIDLIANQPRDGFDRPKTDIRIIRITIQ